MAVKPALQLLGAHWAVVQQKCLIYPTVQTQQHSLRYAHSAKKTGFDGRLRSNMWALPSHDEINLAPVYWVCLGLFVGSRAHWPPMLGPLSAFVRPHFENKLELGWFGFSQTFWNQFWVPWLHGLPNLGVLESYASCKQCVTHAQVTCESPAFGHFVDAYNGMLGSRWISDSSSVYT